MIVIKIDWNWRIVICPRMMNISKEFPFIIVKVKFIGEGHGHHVIRIILSRAIYETHQKIYSQIMERNLIPN